MISVKRKKTLVWHISKVVYFGEGKCERMRRKLDITSMTKIALCVAVLSVSSYLVIPLPLTPIVLSMHTVMVNLVGLIFRPRQAASTILIYLIMGFMGLPVFSGGTAGPGKLLGPTGGFYLQPLPLVWQREKGIVSFAMFW